MVSAGEGHSLAIQDDGHLWAWGNNYYGQLGDSTHADSHTPKEVSTEQWAAVSAGRAFTVAIKGVGTLWAWGANGLGQLGDGTLIDRDPKQIADNSDGSWIAVSAGYSHSLALRADGSLWAWGNGGSGALGDGTTDSHLTPTRIGNGNDWVAVSAGGSHSMALKADGSLWTWGINEGRLGDGTMDDHYSPTCIEPDSVWTAVSAGASQSLALKEDGSLWSWGVNYEGEVGDGTTSRRLAPYRIAGEWLAVTARQLHSMALKADGTLWAWGWNEYYQLGDGTTDDSWVPKQVFNLTVTRLVSGGAVREARDDSFSGAVSATDGRFVVFESRASNLVAGDTNGCGDVFVHDRQTGVTERVSVASNEAQANGESRDVSISADGRYVAFTSSATNLVTGDTSGFADMFVRDRTNGTTTLVSASSGGGPGNGGSGGPAISGNGAFVAFSSEASDLVALDGNGVSDVFRRDLAAGTTARVSVDTVNGDANAFSGGWLSISHDGGRVAFYSNATDLVAGPVYGADAYARDMVAGTTTLVSVADGGGAANGPSGVPAISADGRYVAFDSNATNLVSGGDANGFDDDVLVRDLTLGTTQRVSVSSDGTQADAGSTFPSISEHGEYVSFESYATNLVGDGDDNNEVQDVFLRDVANGTTERVSVASGVPDGNDRSYQIPSGSMSADGSLVTFYGPATNLVAGDTNGAYDVFVRNVEAGQTDRVSVTSGGPVGNGAITQVSVSAERPLRRLRVGRLEPRTWRHERPVRHLRARRPDRRDRARERSHGARESDKVSSSQPVDQRRRPLRRLHVAARRTWYRGTRTRAATSSSSTADTDKSACQRRTRWRRRPTAQR